MLLMTLKDSMMAAQHKVILVSMVEECLES
jgi:hypothetical protein